MILRGLTLWRPWSASIVHGPKRVENRKWAPSPWLLDRGLWVAIHGGRTWDREGASFLALFWNVAQAIDARDGGDVERETDWPANLRAEGIVGVARVARAIRFDDLTEAERSEHGMAFGPWCWFLEDVRALHQPIPCRGAQGLWGLDPGLEARVWYFAGGAP